MRESRAQSKHACTTYMSNVTLCMCTSYMLGCAMCIMLCVARVTLAIADQVNYQYDGRKFRPKPDRNSETKSKKCDTVSVFIVDSSCSVS